MLKLFYFLSTLLFLLSCTKSSDFKKKITSPFECSPSHWEISRRNPLRFIAHAGGEKHGNTYTNSREAMDGSLKKGFRLFELDLIKTRDKRIVAAHDWGHWNKITGANIPHPTLEEYASWKIYKRYQPMTLEDINLWFDKNKNAYLVTDKLRDFDLLKKGFKHQDRLLVEVFSVPDYIKALKAEIKYPILSYEAAGGKNVETFIFKHKIPLVAISAKSIPNHKAFLKRLRANGSCIFAFSSDEEKFLRANFDQYIYGVYTDAWNVSKGSCLKQKCQTY